MKKQLQRINLAEILRNGGATLNENGETVNFSNGYQVSKKDCYKLKVKNINAITKAIYNLLKGIKKGEFVGLWCESGYCYIDISEHEKSIKKALRLGKARKQISIFEWETAKCIYCNA